MGENFLRIRCVVVDDIDFIPMWGRSIAIDMKPMDEVSDLIKGVRKEEPTLQQYDVDSFRVLRIHKPVPPTTDESPSEISKPYGKGGPLSLDPILQRIRQRTRESMKTELANDYVKILPDEQDLNVAFDNKERKFISAIVVRLTTTGESSPAVPHMPFDTIRGRHSAEAPSKKRKLEYDDFMFKAINVALPKFADPSTVRDAIDPEHHGREVYIHNRPIDFSSVPLTLISPIFGRVSDDMFSDNRLRSDDFPPARALAYMLSMLEDC